MVSVSKLYFLLDGGGGKRQRKSGAKKKTVIRGGEGDKANESISMRFVGGEGGLTLPRGKVESLKRVATFLLDSLGREGGIEETREEGVVCPGGKKNHVYTPGGEEHLWEEEEEKASPSQTRRERGKRTWCDPNQRRGGSFRWGKI